MTMEVDGNIVTETEDWNHGEELGPQRQKFRTHFAACVRPNNSMHFMIG